VIAAFIVIGTVVLVPVVVGLISKEVEGWLDLAPIGLLRLARRRLPADQRDVLYEEWAAELHEALHGTESRPLTRLWLGIRYSAGLLRAAPKVAREIGTVRNEYPISASSTRTQTRTSTRTFTLAVSPVHFQGRRVLLELRRFGSGYDPDQVNAVLWKAANDLRDGVDPSEYLDAARFSLVPGGYYEDQVDAFIRMLKAEGRRTGVNPEL
jgi:hypothetical protein